ncbi:hypothetical protein C7W93_23800 [Glaciimonas sp. PCH181]|nr:hypothetical protein C7W93_23800 [Glaciimonas sp. PCH181]
MRIDGIQALNFMGAATRSIFGDTKNARDVTSLAHNLTSVSMNSEQLSGGSGSASTPSNNIPYFTAEHFNAPQHVKPQPNGVGTNRVNTRPLTNRDAETPPQKERTKGSFQIRCDNNDQRTKLLDDVRRRTLDSKTPSLESIRGRTTEEFNVASSYSSSQSPFSGRGTRNDNNDYGSRAASALHPNGRK